jgi:uncharacterized protein
MDRIAQIARSIAYKRLKMLPHMCYLTEQDLNRTDGNLPRKLLELADRYYSPRSVIHHYLNMATNGDREDLQADAVKLKKYFYALRSILAAKLIGKHQTFPPMVFSELLNLISERLDVLSEIDRLLTIKATANETTTIATSPILNDFIRSEIDSCEQEAAPLALGRLFKKYDLSSG